MKAFEFSSTPILHFGQGKISVLPGLLQSYGNSVLLVKGAASFDRSAQGQDLLRNLDQHGFHVELYAVANEPTPEIVDNAVRSFHSSIPDVVVGIGGGSVLDAAKAISAMLPLNASVKDYLEGVGTKQHPGVKIPFVAVPTTAGTGSEATKNAVISEVGMNGFKKSLRHNRFVPDVAILDAELTMSCPPSVTAATGMDAFTQLLESYVSTKANRLSDVMAEEGLRLIQRSLLKVYADPENDEARADMSLAAYLSGITLANAGLGVVHGFASSVGGGHEIPHGVICSAIMSAANSVTVRKLRTEANRIALEKFAQAGKIFCTQNHSRDYCIDALLDFIALCREELNIPRLNKFGLSANDVASIASITDNKFNPASLTVAEKAEILERSF
jgi:alcohol dehydrogenase class IV